MTNSNNNTLKLTTDKF